MARRILGPVELSLKMTAFEARNGRLSTVTLDGEPSLDRPHHTILHPPRTVSHHMLLLLALQLFPPFPFTTKTTPKMAPLYNQIPSLFAWSSAYKMLRPSSLLMPSHPSILSFCLRSLRPKSSTLSHNTKSTL